MPVVLGWLGCDSVEVAPGGATANVDLAPILTRVRPASTVAGTGGAATAVDLEAILGWLSSRSAAEDACRGTTAAPASPRTGPAVFCRPLKKLLAGLITRSRLEGANPLLFAFTLASPARTVLNSPSAEDRARGITIVFSSAKLSEATVTAVSRRAVTLRFSRFRRLTLS